FFHHLTLPYSFVLLFTPPTPCFVFYSNYESLLSSLLSSFNCSSTTFKSPIGNAVFSHRMKSASSSLMLGKYFLTNSIQVILFHPFSLLCILSIQQSIAS